MSVKNASLHLAFAKFAAAHELLSGDIRISDQPR